MFELEQLEEEYEELSVQHDSIIERMNEVSRQIDEKRKENGK